MATTAAPGRVVVVGASLAGLSALEALRQEGYEGELIAVGAETALPYDRPPLSKQVLQGHWEPDKIVLREQEQYDGLGVTWYLGRRATGLDLVARTVTLDDGEPCCGHWTSASPSGGSSRRRRGSASSAPGSSAPRWPPRPASGGWR